MAKNNITPEIWFNLSNKERFSIYSKWNIYKGDGLGIIKAVYERFKHEFEGIDGMKGVNFGIYHGGDWVISVTVEWKHKDDIKFPTSYFGFVIQIFYDDIPVAEMKNRARKQFKIWFKHIKKAYNDEIKNQNEFKNMTKEKLYEMLWLMDGMSKYYNPFKNKK